VIIISRFPINDLLRDPGLKFSLDVNQILFTSAFRKLKSTSEFPLKLDKTLVSTLKKRSEKVARWSCCFAPKQIGPAEILN